jgi:sugar-specific transcriptional regulator TrmB/DNA-binding CsgD family transcriptional regulator
MPKGGHWLQLANAPVVLRTLTKVDGMPDILLEPVGLGAAESTLYVHVLSTPRCTTAQLSESVGMTPARMRPCLRRLVESGLVTRLAGSPARYTAAPPQVAVEALAEARRQQLEQLRTRVTALAAALPGARPGDSGDLVELVEGQAQMRHRVEQMQLGAQREMRVVDCPPYFDNPIANPIEFQLLRRGVSCRVIYDSSGLDDKQRMAFTMACIAAGEEARTLPSVKLKMLIADRHSAMIPMDPGPNPPTAAIFVRASPLLTALATCFDLLWERATPLGATVASGELLDQRDRELLAMLASGMKDSSIVRALGITQRTVTRRVGHILTVLDAQTRFQAGIQAARRGWL